MANSAKASAMIPKQRHIPRRAFGTDLPRREGVDLFAKIGGRGVA